MRFIKYNPDSDMAKYLHTKPIANHLANIIATRARRTICPFTGLKIGQCFLGDYKKIGITEQQYRTAKTLLERINFATFEGTNTGTTATLVSIEVYDINTKLSNGLSNGRTNEQATNETTDEQRQTKNVKNIKNDKELKNNKYIPLYKDLVSFFTEQTGKTIRLKNTNAQILTQGNYKRVAARLKDGVTLEELKAVINLKNNQWKDDKKMQQYITFETLFAPINFGKYLNELDNSEIKLTSDNYKPPYHVPDFENADHKHQFYFTRYVAYTFTGKVDEYKINTEYRQRVKFDKKADEVCFELEKENNEFALMDVKQAPR